MVWSWQKRDIYTLARYATSESQRLLRFDMSPIEAVSNESRLALVRTIYDRLLSCSIRYALEPYDYQRNQQSIRTPQEVLEKPGWGTCLDLSLLFAGLCLAAELFPTVVLLEGHAFVAVSLSYSRSGRPFRALADLTSADVIRNLDELKVALDTDNCVYVECTGFASGKLNDAFPEGKCRPPEGGVLDFDAALRAGKQQLADGGRGLAFAFDVATAHEEWGLLPAPLEPTLMSHRHSGAMLAEALLAVAPLVSDVPPAVVERLYAWAADSAWLRPNFRSRFAIQQAVVLLADAHAAAGRELPLRKFARGVASQLRDERKIEILKALGDDPTILDPVPTFEPAVCERWVLVEVDVETLPPHNLQIASWLLVDGRPPLELVRCSAEAGGAEAVLDLIRTKALNAAASPTIQFDFLLPDELLTAPVDQWHIRQTGISKGVSIGQVHSVVVRPLSRARAAECMVYLKARFAAHAQPLKGECCRIVQKFDGTAEPNAPAMSVDTRKWSASDIFSALASGDNPVFVMLDSAPSPNLCDDGLHGLVAAGVPAMLWLRDPDGDGERERVLDELRGAVNKPIHQRVFELRRQGNLSFRTKVTLLWDDPNRVRPGQSHVLSETARRQ